MEPSLPLSFSDTSYTVFPAGLRSTCKITSPTLAGGFYAFSMGQRDAIIDRSSALSAHQRSLPWKGSIALSGSASASRHADDRGFENLIWSSGLVHVCQRVITIDAEPFSISLASSHTIRVGGRPELAALLCVSSRGQASDLDLLVAVQTQGNARPAQ